MPLMRMDAMNDMLIRINYLCAALSIVLLKFNCTVAAQFTEGDAGLASFGRIISGHINSKHTRAFRSK